MIPKRLRDEAGLHPGAEVEFEREGDRITIIARPRDWASLRGIFAGSGMAERLLEDRAREPR